MKLPQLYRATQSPLMDPNPKPLAFWAGRHAAAQHAAARGASALALQGAAYGRSVCSECLTRGCLRTSRRPSLRPTPHALRSCKEHQPASPEPEAPLTAAALPRC